MFIAKYDIETTFRIFPIFFDGTCSICLIFRILYLKSDITILCFSASCILLSAITGAVTAFLKGYESDEGFETEIQEPIQTETDKQVAEIEPLKPV